MHSNCAFNFEGAYTLQYVLSPVEKPFTRLSYGDVQHSTPMAVVAPINAELVDKPF